MKASYSKLRSMFRSALKTQNSENLKACQDMLDQLFPTPPFNTPVMAYDHLLQLGLSMSVRAQQHTVFDRLLDFYIVQHMDVLDPRKQMGCIQAFPFAHKNISPFCVQYRKIITFPCFLTTL